MDFSGMTISGGVNIEPSPPGNKAIFGYGDSNFATLSSTNKVSNTGVVATDTSIVGQTRFNPSAAGYSLS